MKVLLTLCAICFLAYSLWVVERRPGFLASVAVNGFLFSVFFGGGIGAAATIVTALVSVGAWARQKRIFVLQQNEVFLLGWFLLTGCSAIISIRPDLAGSDAIQLLIFGIGTYTIGRTFGRDRGFIQDLLIVCALGLLICGPQIMLLTIDSLQDGQVGRLGVGTDLSAIGISSSCELPLIGALIALIFPGTVSGKQRFLLLFGGLIALPFAAGVGARGLVLSLGVTGIIYTIIRSRKHSVGKPLAIAAFSSLGVVAAAIILWPVISDTKVGGLLTFGIGRALE